MYAAKEIELKIGVSEGIHQQVVAWLQEHAVYKGTSEQTEYYLSRPNDAWDYSAGFKDTLRTVRVRQEKKGDSFCYKYRHIDPVTNLTTHRDEYETKVKDGAVDVEIMKHLGYTELTMVKKQRITYLVGEQFEVAIDAVEGVGNFIEIELKQDVENVQVGLAMIEVFMRELGITAYKQYDRGYIHMIWNPGFDFGIVRYLE
jgi:predicted adenylyl cyclase CyaB